MRACCPPAAVHLFCPPATVYLCCRPYRVQISKTYTHYAATALFFFFGGRMLYEAVTNAHAGENELDEVEKELEVGDAWLFQNTTGSSVCPLVSCVAVDCCARQWEDLEGTSWLRLRKRSSCASP